MNTKRFRYIIIIAVLSTFLIIGSATARTITSYNTAYAAGVNNASSSATIPNAQINPYTSAMIPLQDSISALQQDNDVSKTLVYMKLAYQQLSAPSNTASLPSFSNHVGPVTTSPTPLSSSSSASSSTSRIIVNNVLHTPNRGNTQSSIHSISQTPAAKKDEKLAQCDARCISLAQQAGISLARQNAKGGITMSLDKIKNSMCVNHTDQYCTVLKDKYQDEYYFIATGSKLQPIHDPPHCSSTSTPIKYMQFLIYHE